MGDGPTLRAGATLVLGGARSGKSRFAEALVAQALRPIYLATAEAGDAEMTARIREHQARRGVRWQTVEERRDLAGALRAYGGDAEAAILVDCLTLWLSNLMHGPDAPTNAVAADGVGDGELARAQDALLAALPQLAAPVVLVSNEVGLGIVPDNALARRFRDEAGRLHQAVAAAAQQVYFIAGGLPIVLKTPS